MTIDTIVSREDFVKERGDSSGRFPIALTPITGGRITPLKLVVSTAPDSA